eukprot:TRINITY_DN2032_c0_g1_i6.p1 TRINITY_DN2032_c0_g1~~TRINITY_DN2032_c0_g1_i6.p1  ORF type:complete len:251 (+),score=55.49 TRINITY_DN2032_c0_g1_i6:85-753(+)
MCIRDRYQRRVHGYFRREILQTYGFEHILTLANLEKVGMLKRQEQKSYWNTLDKNLKLINEEVNGENPNDAAYAYAGYAPITARLVEQVFKKNNWRAINDTLKLLPGPVSYNDKANPEVDKSKPKQVALVYFIGGVTFGEISALRYLAKAYDKEILIATTNMINGNTMLNALQERFKVDAPKQERRVFTLQGGFRQDIMLDCCTQVKSALECSVQDLSLIHI